MAAILYYVHDPMCSWCWGYQPAFARLKAKLPETVEVRAVLGGLAPDSDEPMPEEMQQMLQQTWRRIEGQLGTSFNHDFWATCRPRRSTYPACRAVLAAECQGQGDAMTAALQKAYYLRAMNPSDTETHCLLAGELNLDTVRFARDLASPAVQARLEDHLAFTAALGVSGFPSLVLEINGQRWPIAVAYRNELTSLNDIQDKMNWVNTKEKFSRLFFRS
ncbi:DsbA family protein [Photobacterium sp. 1_MG-2023]|uniref:DsbA family protein n=1 Tax=Photobacterium sp. 1_MG-2023 TaxID=3062646 RepID=UPI0026E3C42C|nr:DsbA family protein [Photobacterium sp. 1_MG-2023]MDO6706880.1 DsbA family protein [Photobacterium sp. 1_MG-2023]